MIPDIKDYNEKKEKGLLSIQKIDEENYAISTKIFSAVDGTQLPSQVHGVTISEVDAAIANKQTDIDELNAFKSDLTKGV